MASYQRFDLDGIGVKYFKEENVLLIQPGPKTNKDKYQLLKNQLETVLNVNSMKMEPGGGMSLKLDQNSAANVAELLRSMNARGGEEVEDAQGLAQDSTEEDVEEEQKNSPQPPAQGIQSPGGAQMGGMGGGMIQAGYMPKTFIILYEGMFDSTSTFNKPKKPGRRTGKYWKPLEAALGKNRAKIIQADVLRKRKETSRKPQNKDRDKLLRSLDKAFDYFFKRLSEDLGRMAAEKYAEDYYAIDDLNPKDYALKKGKAEPIGSDEEFEDGGMQVGQDPLNGPDFSDFSDVLSKGPSSYDDIEIEEDVY